MFGLMIQKLWGFYWDAVSHCQCSKICPKLPKPAQSCPKTISSKNFEIPLKIGILVFFQKKLLCAKGAMKHVYTVWIFNPRFFHMPFLM
jgi:hypothetical protein